MDVSTLKSHIKLKTIPSFLIFGGEEWKVQEIYIQQIAKATGFETKRIDSITDVMSNLRNRSFFKNPIIYIVRDDKELMQNEKIQALIEGGLLGDNILILLLTNIDKRTKFYKQFKERICLFERLSDSLLKKYALKEIKLSESDLERLIDICEHDYGRMLLEIDKIKMYQRSTVDGQWDGVSMLSTHDCFKNLVEDGTIYNPPYDAIFDLVSAILDRKVNRAFDLLQQSYAMGEATLVILSVLYKGAKAVLQIQTYEGDNLSKATGLSGWEIKSAKPHVNKYGDGELIYILQLIQKIERGIKTGRMEDEFAMQYLLTHIM